jgi:hypothetical protein
MTRRSQDGVAGDLAAALRERAADVGGEDDLYQRIVAVAATSPQSRRFARWSASGRLPTMTVPARVVAAAVIAVLAVGGLYYVSRFDRSAEGVPSPTPSAEPTEPAVVGPSATPTATPSSTPTPLLWTHASLKEDWPAPVRSEPAGGAILVPILTKREDSGTNCPRDCGVNHTPGRHIDPSGDTGSDDVPWVDIQAVGVTTHVVTFTLPNLRPDVDPTEQWIAYGVVFDDDRDGVPDRRVGMENAPRTVTGQYEMRVWITDLHTGRTAVQRGDYVGETYVLVMGYAGQGVNGVRFSFGANTTGGGTKGTSLVNRPLYVWASVIQDGRVVATDYAPDVGWLDTSLETTRVP